MQKKTFFFRCGRENNRLFSEFFPIFYKTSSPARAGGGGFPDWMTDRPTSGGGFPDWMNDRPTSGGGFPDWMNDRPTSGGGFPTG